MSEQTMSADDKQQVKDVLLARSRAQVEASQESIDDHESAAEVDQDSSLSVDALSQADAAGDLTALFEENAAKQAADVAAIEALDVSPKTSVEPGAIVGFGGARYLVGVVADSFDVDGTSYEGISLDSPVYAAIEGLVVGDQFSVNDRKQSIDFLA